MNPGHVVVVSEFAGNPFLAANKCVSPHGLAAPRGGHRAAHAVPITRQRVDGAVDV